MRDIESEITDGGASVIFDNPVLKKELLSGLRSPRAFLVQLVYIVFVSATILPVWPPADLPTIEFQVRSSALFKLFVIGQFVIIALVAPAVAAPAFASEKERRVYDLIYTSPMQMHRIVLGKLLSAILFLLLLIVSSAPALSVCFQLGGISSEMVVNAYLFLFAAAVLCGMSSLYISSLVDRSAIALMLSYLILLPAVTGISIYADSSEFLFSGTIVPLLAFFSFWVAVLLYAGTLSALRKPYNPVATGLEGEQIGDGELIGFDRNSFPDNLLAPARRDTFIPDGANPIYEKELRSEIFGRGTRFIRLIVLLGLGTSVFFIYRIFVQQSHIYIYYLLSFGILVAPAFAAGAFTLERERETLDMLIVTKVRPSSIVLGKFLAVVRFTTVLTLLLTIPLLQWPFLSLAESGDYRGGLPGVAAALAWYLAITFATILLACAVSMAISLTARSTVEAMLKSYLVLLIVFVGGLVVFLIIRRYATKAEAIMISDGWLYAAGASLALVSAGLVVWRSIRLGNPTGIPANLLAYMPFLPVIFLLVMLAKSALTAGEERVPAEALLGLGTPYLAAVRVTEDLLESVSTFHEIALPHALSYIALASSLAVAILISITLRWRQVMFVEGARGGG